MVFHLESLGTLKSIAKVIERKYPGSCTGFIKAIDDIQYNPAYIKERYKDLREKWEKIKSELLTEQSPAEADESFDITDVDSWKEFTTKHIWDTENNEMGFVESIVESLKDVED